MEDPPIGYTLEFKAKVYVHEQNVYLISHTHTHIDALQAYAWESRLRENGAFAVAEIIEYHGVSTYAVRISPKAGGKAGRKNIDYRSNP